MAASSILSLSTTPATSRPTARTDKAAPADRRRVLPVGMAYGIAVVLAAALLAIAWW